MKAVVLILLSVSLVASLPVSAAEKKTETDLSKRLPSKEESIKRFAALEKAKSCATELEVLNKKSLKMHKYATKDASMKTNLSIMFDPRFFGDAGVYANENYIQSLQAYLDGVEQDYTKRHSGFDYTSELSSVCKNTGKLVEDLKKFHETYYNKLSDKEKDYIAQQDPSMLPDSVNQEGRRSKKVDARNGENNLKTAGSISK